MNEFAVLAAVAACVMLFVVAEIAAAALPLVLVIALVPPHQREELAKLLAACDSSRKLRLWTALRAAVKARRLERDRDPDLNTHGDLEAAFTKARDHAPANRPQSPAGR
jgi:hypothetical protein